MSIAQMFVFFKFYNKMWQKLRLTLGYPLGAWVIDGRMLPPICTGCTAAVSGFKDRGV